LEELEVEPVLEGQVGTGQLLVAPFLNRVVVEDPIPALFGPQVFTPAVRGGGDRSAVARVGKVEK